ncbi:GntR family transcriptional regulator [Pacificibacter sp. AS14]|uniref:GntR family transcriptional regulator n=1 Tax=Pacificibacter sp. AS14 TaxID=3135785 RepID=UPI003181AC96
MLDNYKAYIRRDPDAPNSKTTRASVLTARLRAAILRGELKSGQKVNLDRLRDKYGVSLSPLREAISRLSIDGLVHTQDQRGSTIAPMTLRELTEIGRLRREVDVLAMRTAMAHGGTEWRSNLRTMAVELHTASQSTAAEYFDEIWSIAHTNFHKALVSGSQMPMLNAFCMNLHDLHDRYRRQLSPPDVSYSGLWREHAEIASCVLNGSADVAALALQAHFDKEIATLAERLENAS